jgi:hypothetical protein
MPQIRALKNAKKTALVWQERHGNPPKSPSPDVDLKIIAASCSIILTVQEFDSWNKKLSHKVVEADPFENEQQRLSAALLGSSSGPLVTIARNRPLGPNRWLVVGNLTEAIDRVEITYDRILPSFVAITATAVLNESADKQLSGFLKNAISTQLQFGKRVGDQYNLSLKCPPNAGATRLERWHASLLDPAIRHIRLPPHCEPTRYVPVYSICSPSHLFGARGPLYPDTIDWPGLGFCPFFEIYGDTELVYQPGFTGFTKELLVANWSEVLRNRRAHEGPIDRIAIWLHVDMKVRGILITSALKDHLQMLTKIVAVQRERLLGFRQRAPGVGSIAGLYKKHLGNWMLIDRISFEITSYEKRLRRSFKESNTMLESASRLQGISPRNLPDASIDELIWLAGVLKSETKQLREMLQEYINVKNVLYGYRVQWAAILLAVVAISISLYQAWPNHAANPTQDQATTHQQHVIHLRDNKVTPSRVQKPSVVIGK